MLLSGGYDDVAVDSDGPNQDGRRWWVMWPDSWRHQGEHVGGTQDLNPVSVRVLDEGQILHFPWEETRELMSRTSHIFLLHVNKVDVTAKVTLLKISHGFIWTCWCCCCCPLCPSFTSRRVKATQTSINKAFPSNKDGATGPLPVGGAAPLLAAEDSTHSLASHKNNN